MALNLDDLIGSMQHSCNAGDRGDDIQSMRESLTATLGNQALGPPNQNNQWSRNQQPHTTPSIYQTSQSQRRVGGGSSGNGRNGNQNGWKSSNELSNSFGRTNGGGIQVPATTPNSAQFYPSGSMEKRRNHLNSGERPTGGNPSSMASDSSSSTNSMSGNSNSSFGQPQPPMNTPLATPVENDGLEDRYHSQHHEGSEMIQDQQSHHGQNQNQSQNFINENNGSVQGDRFTRRLVGGFDNGTWEIPPQNA